MSRVAVLGLGAMGRRMAARLLAAGHDVVVWNRSPGPAEELAAELAVSGARVAGSPREAAAWASFVIAMVYDDAASRAVWLDPHSGAFAGLRPGAVALDCATLSPAHVRRLHDEAGARGLAFLDAPLAGSRPQAEAGELVFMVGGAAEHLTAAEPVLRAMGRAVHHAGGPAAGTLVKLMVNVLLASQVATLAEGLALAARAGLDPAAAFAIVSDTPVAGPSLRGAGAAMLARDFRPQAPVDLIVKDLGLARAAGEAAGLSLPMAAAAERLYRQAAALGLGPDNLTGIVKLYLVTRS